MVKPTRPAANGFVAAMRKIYNPLGFSKGYNFVLFFITIGYLMGFTLARLQYFSFYGIFCNPNSTTGGAAPGECYYYLQNPRKIGIMIHLFTILPATFLVCFQFVPAIRHKAILLHRINGYLVILLSTVASAGALMIADRAFGGDMSTRTYVGILVISTTVCYILAWINIKRLQIDQHRAWMMRAWAYFGTIITLRIVQILSTIIISSYGGWSTVWPCAKISSIVGPETTLQFYPGCASFVDGSNPTQEVIVSADFNSQNPAEIGSALGIPFGPAGWIALWLHVIFIEVYLHLTPAESERLRQVSYERQLERGFKHPGSAGIVAQRFGDANPFVPKSKQNADGEDAIKMLPSGYARASHNSDDSR